MESVLVAALVAAAPVPPADAAAAASDVQCFRLMAELADDEDARVRSIGRMAAQYFLGRIDATAPGFDPTGPRAARIVGEREPLMRRCGEAMGAGGRDFRAIGEALAPATRPAT